MGALVEHVITSLYTIAENSDYSDWKDQMIRNRIVVGMHDHVAKVGMIPDGCGFDLGESNDPCATM